MAKSKLNQQAAPAPKRGTGRPSKFDDAKAEQIIKAVKMGAWRRVAALWCGVGERTLQEWMEKGKKNPTSKFGAFRARVIEAEAGAEIRVGAGAFRRAAEDADFGLKYLAVRWRKRWNPKHEHELSGGDRPVTVQHVGADFSRLSNEEVELLEKVMVKLTPEEP